jgi:hypothetical protein
VDTLRESDSISAWRSSSQPPLEAFRFSSGKWAPVEDSMVANINSEGTSSLSTTIEEKQQKELNDSMYNLGNLRKTMELHLIICCTFIKSLLLFVIVISLPQVAQIVHGVIQLFLLFCTANNQMKFHRHI